MAFALFRTESFQRINCPIRTNTQRFCLARAVHYQPAPHHPGIRQEPLGNSPKSGNSPYRCEYFGIYRPVSVGDGAATFSVDALVNRIPLKQGETEGEAKLTVQFKKLPFGPDKVTLKIGNAELLNADGEGVASDRNKNEVTITGAAGVTRRAVLRLGALADSEIVTIVSAGSRGNVEVAGPKDALRLTAKAAAGQAARSASAASGN
jgi:hypothetical protein